MVRNESAGEKLFLHDICCHDIQWAYDVWHNRATFHCYIIGVFLFNFCYHLDYGHLTVSSVSHTSSYLLRPVTISKLTTTNRFSKRLILGWINRALHVSKLKCSAGVLYECWEHSAYLITAITGESAISPAPAAPPAGRMNLHLQVGQRKTLIGRPLLQTLKLIVLPPLHLLLVWFERKGHFIVSKMCVFICLCVFIKNKFCNNQLSGPLTSTSIQIWTFECRL